MRLRDDPEFWRGRAEQVRVIQERMTSPSAKEAMERAAESYDFLAEEAEKKLARRRPVVLSQ